MHANQELAADGARQAAASPVSEFDVEHLRNYLRNAIPDLQGDMQDAS